MPDDVKGRLGGQDMQGLIRAVRMVLMTRELGLTEEQAARITAIESDQEESTRDLTQRRQETFRRLRNMVKDESYSPQSVDESMEELDRIADESHGQSRDSERRILELLEPEQKVKFTIFKQRFRRDLMAMVERVRRMVQAGEPPPKDLIEKLKTRRLEELGKRGPQRPRGSVPGRRGPAQKPEEAPPPPPR
jgi:Spy/CpxP family protein refolding chaperone